MSDSKSDSEAVHSALIALETGKSDLTPEMRSLLERLVAENRDLMGRLGALRQDLSDALILADRDVLCAVLNRRAFTREIEREIALATRHSTQLSLLFLDLDNFKQVNDALGHKAGDDLLKVFSDSLVSGVRRTDIVGRLGGDEFGVLLIGADGAQAAKQVARIARHLKDSLLEAHSVSVSIGLATWSGGFSVDDLLAAADRAMFQEKKSKPL